MKPRTRTTKISRSRGEAYDPRPIGSMGAGTGLFAVQTTTSALSGAANRGMGGVPKAVAKVEASRALAAHENKAKDGIIEILTQKCKALGLESEMAVAERNTLRKTLAKVVSGKE